MISIQDLTAQFGFNEIDKLIFQAQYTKISLVERLRYLYFAYNKIIENIQKFEFRVNETKKNMLSAHLSQFESDFQIKTNEYMKNFEKIFISSFSKELRNMNIELMLYPQKDISYPLVASDFTVLKKMKLTYYSYDDFKFATKLKNNHLYFIITFKDKKKFLLISLPPLQKKYVLLKRDSLKVLVNLSLILQQYLQLFLPFKKIDEVLEFRIYENFMFHSKKYNQSEIANLFDKHSCIEANKIRDIQFFNQLVGALGLTNSSNFLTKRAIFLDDMHEVLEKVLNFDNQDLNLNNNVYPKNISDNFMNINIINQDKLFHHPYQSYQELIDFFYKIANTPDVSKIQLTLYHIEKKSKIVQALILAAQNNIKVEVYVEVNVDDNLKDVYAYIRLLKRNNIKVYYNAMGPVVHAKMCLISFKHSSLKKSISVLSTGNFNEKNAQTYCDFTMITSHSGINKDLKKIFDFIFYKKKLGCLKHVFFSAHNLRKNLNLLLKHAKSASKDGDEVEIFLKTKHVTDIELIKKISKMSCPVNIQIRNACIIPYKKNIKLYSFIGKYLEHHRVYYFKIKNKDYLYLGSASLTAKNIDHRYELIFPVYQPAFIERIKEDTINNIKQRNHACWHLTQHGYQFNYDESTEDIQTFLNKKYILHP